MPVSSWWSISANLFSATFLVPLTLIHCCLRLPFAPDLKAPKLKKIIDMLPTELHRAFFRLLLSGITAKYHLSDVYDDGYPAFILGGETKSFKTALAKVVCRLLGLKPEENIYPLFSAIAGEFGIPRFRTKGFVITFLYSRTKSPQVTAAIPHKLTGFFFRESVI